MQLFVEQLTVIDFAYLDPEYGIVGESLICDVTLHGGLDEQGMIMDFGPMKKRIKDAIDGWMDHALVTASQDAHLTAEESGETVTLKYRLNDEAEIIHQSPKEAVFLLDAEAVTPEAMTRYLESALMAVVHETVTRVEIQLRTEIIESAYYHYAHGLKKHEGNCQRIAHGHRSKLLVWVNGTPAPELASEWADQWKHIYIGTREDIAETLQVGGVDYYEFRYRAPQGAFMLRYPVNCCHIIDTESTVENISHHIADQLHVADSGQNYTVRAYEGVQKGAVSSA